MELIISFYDNSLVYYPNIFFAAILLSTILVGIYFVKLVRYLWTTIRAVHKKMASRKYMKDRDKRGIATGAWAVLCSIPNSIRRGVRHVNSILRQLELYVQKIGKKIRKELFIERERHE